MLPSTAGCFYLSPIRPGGSCSFLQLPTTHRSRARLSPNHQTDVPGFTLIGPTGSRAHLVPITEARGWASADWLRQIGTQQALRDPMDRGGMDRSGPHLRECHLATMWKMDLRGAGLEAVAVIQVREDQGLWTKERGQDRCEPRWLRTFSSLFFPFQPCFFLSWLSVPMGSQKFHDTSVSSIWNQSLRF